MTTTTLTSSPAATRTPERDLRTLLRADAAVTVVSGLVALVDAGWVGDVLGVDAIGWIRLVGALLVVFAVDLALVGRASTPTLRRWSPAFAVADVAWAAATVVLIAAGAFSTVGTVVAAVIGLAVLEVGLVVLRLRKRL